MVSERLGHQIAFLREVDRLKGVLRRSYVLAGERRENSAEHCWHVALAALVLAEHAAEPVDVARVVQMLLLHDLVEIDAGDTFVYDPAGQADKAAREQAPRRPRLFALLPSDQGAELAALWEEFEARRDPRRPLRRLPRPPAAHAPQPLVRRQVLAGARHPSLAGDRGQPPHGRRRARALGAHPAADRGRRRPGPAGSGEMRSIGPARRTRATPPERLPQGLCRAAPDGVGAGRGRARQPFGQHGAAVPEPLPDQPARVPSLDRRLGGGAVRHRLGGRLPARRVAGGPPRSDPRPAGEPARQRPQLLPAPLGARAVVAGRRRPRHQRRRRDAAAGHDVGCRPGGGPPGAGALPGAHPPRQHNLGFAVGPAVGGVLATVDYRWLFIADGGTCAAASLSA